MRDDEAKKKYERGIRMKGIRIFAPVCLPVLFFPNLTLYMLWDEMKKERVLTTASCVSETISTSFSLLLIVSLHHHRSLSILYPVH